MREGLVVRDGAKVADVVGLWSEAVKTTSKTEMGLKTESWTISPRGFGTASSHATFSRWLLVKG